MTLSNFSIRNPVFAVMLSAAMVVFGYLSYREMGISQFPEIDFPVVSITTYREAASPETMPTSFILDGGGKVRFLHNGFHGETTRKEYISEIESLLK